MEWMDYKGMKVFIQIETIDGIRRYQGFISDVVYLGKDVNNIQNYFLELTDKYGMKVGFASSQIKLIQQER